MNAKLKTCLVGVCKTIAFLVRWILGIGAVMLVLWWTSQKPSLNRDWTADQAILPSVTFSETEVAVRNVRDFSYESVDVYTPRYLDQTYRLQDIQSLYFVIEPFSSFDGPAHTMLSFGFSGGTYVTISPEIRKERGESFSPLDGILNTYEMAYVIGTERDLIGLRANHRKDEVYLYPIKATPEQIRAIFLSATRRADKLSREPEFYNTLWNNCATSVRAHANAIREEKIPWSIELLLPSHADRIAFDRGLIDTKMSLEDARPYYQINAQAADAKESQNFSALIRKERK